MAPLSGGLRQGKKGDKPGNYLVYNYTKKMYNTKIAGITVGPARKETTMYSKRPSSYAMSIRMDLRDFASIVSGYRRMGLKVDSVGAYGRAGLENMASIMRKQGIAEEFKSYDDANNYLYSVGLRKQLRNTRLRANIADIISENEAEVTDFSHTAEMSAEPLSRSELSEEDNEKVPSAEEVLRRLENLGD